MEDLDKLWDGLDAERNIQPEDFSESLQKILPDLSKKNEIEKDLLSKLVFACGDVSLVDFIRLSKDAIVAADTISMTIVKLSLMFPRFLHHSTIQESRI